MKYVLIALIVKDLVVSPPWATSIVAEFNDLPACEAVLQRMEPYRRPPFNAQVRASCFPKGSEPRAEPK